MAWRNDLLTCITGHVQKPLDKMLRHLPRPLRPVPVKQGWMLKQGDNVVKEWKSKYCVLGRGILTYYPSALVWVAWGVLVGSNVINYYMRVCILYICIYHMVKHVFQAKVGNVRLCTYVLVFWVGRTTLRMRMARRYC